MWNKWRLPVMTGGVAVVMAAVAVAQNSSSSNSSEQPSATTQTSNANDASTTQPSATNPSNLPGAELSTTEQQSKAPVVDPQASAQKAADAKAGIGQSSPGQAGGTAAGNAVNNSNSQSSATSEWPARSVTSRIGRQKGSVARSGGASLGINVTGSNDGRGIVIQRVRPGTAADQMGLQQRDRILSLNGQPVVSVGEFISAIRGMNAGDEVQITIDRSGSSRDIAGRLEALRDVVAIGDRPVGSIAGRARDFVGRVSGENMQTSYEDRSPSNSSSRDFDIRLMRVEQQIDQLMREVSELRIAMRPGSVTGGGSTNVNTPGLPASPGTTPDASALRTTPGQPSTQPQPQSR